MSAPIRIRLSRRKGARLPPNTVVVARPSKWGNPYKIGETVQRYSAEKICETFVLRDAAMAVEAYREHMRISLAQHAAIIRPQLEELRGKNLACWCGPGPCHTDVLLELANV